MIWIGLVFLFICYQDPGLIALLQAPLRHKAAALLFGYRQDIEFLGEASVDHLQWLQEQPAFPRFYWQSRDGELEIAAAGAAKLFTSLELAQQFIQYCAPTDFQPLLVGGVRFPQSCADVPSMDYQPSVRSLANLREVFFLPKQALIRRGQLTFLVTFVSLRHPPSVQNSQILTEMKDRLTLQQWPLPQLHARVDQPNRNQWCDLVTKVIQPDALAIAPKVVLARRSRFRMEECLNQFALLRQWQQVEPHTTPFLFQFKADSCFLGCTPERLYRRRGRDLITEALAGTIEKVFSGQAEATSASALRSDVKIRRENYLVQDYIRRQLMSLCESVQVSPFADVVELKYIQHLRKLITGLLRAGVVDGTILQALHPTPAVGGSPRGQALEFIETHEHFNRGWYAGAIGYLSADEAEFSVAIRSAQIRHRQIDFFAGAGIVAGSKAIAEWQELDNKIASVLNLFESVDSSASI
jgi:menaquinone-specific isochorismate synthase